MTKVVLLAFRGELGCFAHVLLHALDLTEKGFEAKIILEGTATALIRDLAEEGQPFAPFYREVRDKNLIACICEACAGKAGVLDEARAQGLNIVGDMKGHPSIDAYLCDGWDILAF